MRVLSRKQTQAVARALGRKNKRIPTVVGRCVFITKTGKSKAFGVLPVGTTTEICRDTVGGREVITARVMNSPRKRRK